MSRILGVDLGTTFSCSAYYNEEKLEIEIIPSQDGDLVIPSTVYFDKDLILVGKIAGDLLKKSASKEVLSHIVSNSKRFIGKLPNEIEDMYIYYLTDKLSQLIDVSGEMIKYMIDDSEWTPTNIAMFILRYIKSYSEEYTGCIFDEIVITVPAYFNEFQRQETKKAALDAGFKRVARIINEPTAAALAYGYEYDKLENVETSEVILVLDTGGGTTDFSVVELDYLTEMYQTKNTFGDSFLGGEDVTELISEYLWIKVKEMYPKMSEEIIKSEYRLQKAKSKLKQCAERCKKDLSYKDSTVMYLEAFYNDIDISLSLTRIQMNEISKPFFDKLYKVLDWIVKDSISKGYLKDVYDLSGVLFIGGTTRIPYIYSMVKGYFKDQYNYIDIEIKNTMNPDTTVAYGAAVQAYILDESIKKDLESFDPILMDILPLSIGIELDGGIMSIIVTRGSILPTTKMLEFQTSKHYISELEVDIYQGERRFVKDNFYLGSFTLTNITEAMKGQVLITIEITVDLNGMYLIKGYETKNKIKTEKQIVISGKDIKSDVSQERLNDMILKAEQFRFKDLILSKKMEKKIELYDKFMELLEIFQDRKEVLLEELTPETSYTAYRFNTLFNKTWSIIENFNDYSVVELEEAIKEFRESFYVALCEISEFDLIETDLSTKIGD